MRRDDSESDPDATPGVETGGAALTPDLDASARAVAALVPAALALEAAENVVATCAAASARGWFKPPESEALRAWFAQYLTIRAALREVVDDLRPMAQCAHRAEPDETMRAFAIGYVAACTLVRMGRFLVAQFAADPIVQRKLNEASETHRYPRKQYTTIRRSLTHPVNALRLRDAMRFVDRERDALVALSTDTMLAPVMAHFDIVDGAPRIGSRAYLWGRVRYRWHAWRRRRASAAQQVLFSLAEWSGRMIAEVRNPFHIDRLHGRTIERFGAFLQPCDIIATRHDEKLSNLFLPGYWPHVALYTGSIDDARALGVTIPEDRVTRWSAGCRVLEAKKDGVRLRSLAETLAVDAAVILRPRLSDADRGRALTQALATEGKLYNFDFDFFTDDRIVCTEVVYRALDGVGGVDIPLVRRAGRVTLSAEDLVDRARDASLFDTIATFGVPDGEAIVEGPAARELLGPVMTPAPEAGSNPPEADDTME